MFLRCLFAPLLLAFTMNSLAADEPADRIFIGGKIATADREDRVVAKRSRTAHYVDGKLVYQRAAENTC